MSYRVPPVRRRALSSAPNSLTAAAARGNPAAPAMEVTQGTNTQSLRHGAMAASAQVFKSGSKAASNTGDERQAIATIEQIEAYRHAQTIGEARYSAVLFSNLAGRAEIGVSEAQALAKQAVWITKGPEVDALADVAATVRERTKLIRDYMLHWTIAGECYLIARERRPTDPGYVDPPMNPDTDEVWTSWDEHLRAMLKVTDMLDPDFDEDEFMVSGNPNLDNPIWEIVSVMELRRLGKKWEVKHDGGNWLELRTDDPVIRMWNPKPGDRREAWSPFISMADTLREIEWMTKDIFTQVRSRLKSAGVWFLPDNLTFPEPPPDSVEGGAAAIAELNEAELFAISLSNASMELLDGETVAMPTIVMVDPAALAGIDKGKLITFWNEIDSESMKLRSDSVRRFALGMDLPPEQVLGSSGLAVTDSGGSAGSVNHWGVWANEEQTISAHIEPALDVFTGILTVAILRPAVENTTLVIAYDTVSLRMRQDRSEVSITLYGLGLLSGKTTIRECGFDPESDMMDDKELSRWVLMKMVSGSWAPEQAAVAARLLGAAIPDMEVSGNGAGGTDGRHQPPNTDGIENRGKPQEDHEHNPAPYRSDIRAFEALTLRALEKNGAKLLNTGKRGRNRDRVADPHNAHTIAQAEGGIGRTVSSLEFDFSSAHMVLSDLDPAQREPILAGLARFCADITNQGRAYDRAALIEALESAA